MKWQVRAACRTEPSSKFFLDEMGDHTLDAYKPVCDRCPVRSECLETALIYNFDGVWGGLSKQERLRMFGEDYGDYLREELVESGDYQVLKHIA